MKTSGIVTFVVVPMLVAVLVTGAAAAAASSPTIRFAGLSPTKARGTHFGAQEQVKVTLSAGTAKRVRTTRASDLGTFMVSFGTLADEYRCSGQVSLLATGARGHMAHYRLPTMACPTMTADKMTADR